MEGDAALLRRMLDNLIRNSIVHNPQGCHISVTVGAEDGRCACTVTDDGVGMDHERLESLFNFKKDETVKTPKLRYRP